MSSKERKGNFFINNFFGAFSDTALLIPIVILLSAKAASSFFFLLLSSGIFYIVAGLFFKIPMPIQPLKAVAVGGISLGASSADIRAAGAVIGILLTVVVLIAKVTRKLNIDYLFSRIPPVIIHGIQLSLGIILIKTGFKELALSGDIFLTTTSFFLKSLLAVLAIFFIIYSERIFSFSFLGIFAATGLVICLLSGQSLERISLLDSSGTSANMALVFSLALPQLVLTLSNSVAATIDTAKRYFGEKSKNVNASNLLFSIGLGNIFSALFCGLPFCHGSGGLTAHVKGGSNHYISNIIIGTTLILTAFLSFNLNLNLLSYPPFLICVLLATIGVFHIGLAKPSWNILSHRAVLIFMGAGTLLTGNLVYSLLIGSVVNFAVKGFFGKWAYLKKTT